MTIFLERRGALMVDDTEKHTIQLLREMHKEINERFDEVDHRIDGVTYILTMLAGNMGWHDQRLEDLEAAVADLQKT